MNHLLVTLYPFFCVFVPCFFYLFLKSKKRGACLFGRHFLWVCIFLLYLCMVLDATGIGTIWDIGNYDRIITFDKINLIPFTDITGISQFLNAFMFMPFGFLLPFIWKEFRTPFKTVLAGAGYSLAIEACQLFNNRVSDIDDLFMNTFGTLFGYLIWILFVCLFHPKGGDREISVSRHETAACLLLSIAGQFLLYNWRWAVNILLS